MLLSLCGNNTAAQLCCAKEQEFDDINKVCAHKGSVVCGDLREFPPLSIRYPTIPTSKVLKQESSFLFSAPRVDCRGKADGDYAVPTSL